ncbi:MAG: hypothetical protein M3Y82_04360, partial [Verrucomicrobiota bacterium]|nr:hypothetical protein [Verrucomicrobiota bacterium]
HTGPLFDDTRRKYLHDAAMAKFGNDPAEKIYYPDFLADSLVKVIGQAAAQLQPAELETALARREGLSFNRRYHMKNGKVAFNPGVLNPNIVGPAGPVDPDVGILLIKKQKKFLGGLTVFAVHLDCVGGTLYSADCAYYVEQTLRKSLGEKFISAYAAGTCGDLNNINVNTNELTKGYPVAEKIGTALGQTILQEIPKLTPIKQPSLKMRSETIIVPLQEPTPPQMEFARTNISKLTDSKTPFFTKVEAVKYLDLAEKGKTWPLEVQVFRLDSETALVGLPCEIFVELGLAIKAASPFSKTIVMSICNDRPSYVPTKKAFTEGSYEVTNARVQPGVGETLVETAVKLLKEIK